MESYLNLNNNQIKNVKEATSGNYAVNFKQLHNGLSNYLHETGGTMKDEIQTNFCEISYIEAKNVFEYRE